MRKPGLKSGLALAVLTVVPGCARGVIENQQGLYGRFAPSKITQSNNRYKCETLTVMGEQYFVHKTVDGQIGLFKIDQATRKIKPGTKDTPRLLSGERDAEGNLVVYVLRQAQGKEGIKNKFLDYVTLRTEGERSSVAKIVKTKDDRDLAVRRSTERDCQYKHPTVNVEGLGRCYVVKVPTEKVAKAGESYDFYLIKIDENTEVTVENSGKTTIESTDNIWRAFAESVEVLKENKKKADEAAKKKADTEAAEAKKKVEEEAKKKAEEEKKKQVSVPGTINSGAK